MGPETPNVYGALPADKQHWKTNGNREAQKVVLFIMNRRFTIYPTYNPSSFLPNHLFLCIVQTKQINTHLNTAAAPQPQPVAHAKLLGPSHALICPHHRRWCDCLDPTASRENPPRCTKEFGMMTTWLVSSNKLLAGWAYSKGVAVGFC